MVIHISLDSNNPRWYTCGNRLHCKMALLYIISFLILAEIIETIAYVNLVKERNVTLNGILSEAYELFILFTLIVAWWKENRFCLLPYILQLFITIIMFMLLIAHIVLAIFLPFSDYANLFIDPRDKGFWNRETSLLKIFVIMVLIALIPIWMLQIGLNCYQYFECRQAEKALKNSRPPLPLVMPQGENGAMPNSNPAGSSQVNARPSVNASGKKSVPNNPPSFKNPNFSWSDDEDEIFDNKLPNQQPAIV